MNKITYSPDIAVHVHLWPTSFSFRQIYFSPPPPLPPPKKFSPFADDHERGPGLWRSVWIIESNAIELQTLSVKWGEWGLTSITNDSTLASFKRFIWYALVVTPIGCIGWKTCQPPRITLCFVRLLLVMVLQKEMIKNTRKDNGQTDLATYELFF